MKNLRLVLTCQLFLVLTLILPGTITAQDTTYRQQYELEYSERIKKTHINGRYIPKDLDEAIVELDKIVDMVGKAKFKAQPEENAVRKLHFSFGKWLIVNWGFYEGSRFSHFLRSHGVTYPDDMAATVMTCYHRHLNGRVLDFDSLAEAYAEKRQKEVSDRLHKGQVIEKRTLPKN
ncbi:MAG: hypothetical protein HKN76_18560 [Saprospiraceae bacterium]|nr:hypothetical protein [Saprospiraceae bacterium]